MTGVPVGERDDIEMLAKGGRANVAGFFIRLIARIPFLVVATASTTGAGVSFFTLFEPCVIKGGLNYMTRTRQDKEI